MKSFIARLGGTAFEGPLLKFANAISPMFTRSAAEERHFWLRQGLSRHMLEQLAPLRASILETSAFFSVPTSDWLIEPIGVASHDLESALTASLGQSKFDLVSAVSRVDLSFESDWSPLTSLSKRVLAKISNGELQVAFVLRGSMGTDRRMLPLLVWSKNSNGNLETQAITGVFSQFASGSQLHRDLERASGFDNLQNVTFPIDAVYLWVDGNDPGWTAKKAEHDASASASHGSAESRFISRNELYFSIRSLRDHARWVNKIWVVTDGQTPDLAELADSVTVIDHKDFIPSEYLPTFNSHAITANLHRIPGLSENFLYLNDDIFFGRNLHPGIWFDAFGRSIVRYTKTLLPGFETNKLSTIHRIRQNTVQLGHEAGYKTTTRSIQHGPHPLQKSVMNELWQKHQDRFDQTCRNKFRSETDIVPEWLHNFAAISSGRAFIGGYLTYRYVVLNAKASLPKIMGLFIRTLPSVLCLNDVAELGENELASEPVIENRLRLIAQLLETKK